MTRWHLHGSPEWAEAASAASAMVYGLMLSTPGLFDAYPRVFHAMSSLAPQHLWSAAYVTAGCVQAVALFHGDFRARVTAASLLAGAWMFLVLMYWGGWPFVPAVSLFAVQASANFAVSLHLARINRPARGTPDAGLD